MNDWSMYLYQGCLIVVVPGGSTANYGLCKLVIIKFIKQAKPVRTMQRCQVKPEIRGQGAVGPHTFSV